MKQTIESSSDCIIDRVFLPLYVESFYRILFRSLYIHTGQKGDTSWAGTLRWAAPEVIPEEPQQKIKYTTASDVYSYGVTIWEMITNRLPFIQYAVDCEVSFYYSRIKHLKIKQLQQYKSRTILLLVNPGTKFPGQKPSFANPIEQKAPKII